MFKMFKIFKISHYDYQNYFKETESVPFGKTRIGSQIISFIKEYSNNKIIFTSTLTPEFPGKLLSLSVAIHYTLNLSEDSLLLDFSSTTESFIHLLYTAYTKITENELAIINVFNSNENILLSMILNKDEILNYINNKSLKKNDNLFNSLLTLLECKVEV